MPLPWHEDEESLESSPFCLLLPCHGFSGQWLCLFHRTTAGALSAPCETVLPSHMYHSLVGTGVQVVGGKKGEVNSLIPYPLCSFPHPGKGVVLLWDAGRAVNRKGKGAGGRPEY